MEYLGYISCLFIGLTLGLIGGGGSILTVPILVYLFQIKPEIATGYSLFVVGITASVGAVRHYLLGNLQIKTGFLFAIPSTVSIVLTRKYLLPFIPDPIFQVQHIVISKDIFLLLVFAVLMLISSILILNKAIARTKSVSIKPIRLASIGLLAGIITGFLGAGGGFLIIPSLLFFGRLSMKQAIGTSLLIISFSTLMGFMGDLIHGVAYQYFLLFKITALALIGLFLGTYLSKKISGAKLKPIFGWFVLSMGCYIIIKSIFFT